MLKTLFEVHESDTLTFPRSTFGARTPKENAEAEVARRANTANFMIFFYSTNYKTARRRKGNPDEKTSTEVTANFR